MFRGPGGSVLRGPALKGGHGEQRHHGHEHVVEVELAVEPQPLVDGGLVHVTVLVQDVGPSAGRQGGSSTVTHGPQHTAAWTQDSTVTQAQTQWC